MNIFKIDVFENKYPWLITEYKKLYYVSNRELK